MPSFYAKPVHDRFTPVPVRSRHDGWTVERQRRFIAEIGRGLSAERAARAVGMSGRSAHRLAERTGAGSFRKAWRVAADLARPLPEQRNPLYRFVVKTWRGRVVHREVRWNESAVIRVLVHHDPYTPRPHEDHLISNSLALIDSEQCANLATFQPRPPIPRLAERSGCAGSPASHPLPSGTRTKTRRCSSRPRDGPWPDTRSRSARRRSG